ncbi:GTP-binding protein YchF [Spirochaeta thermophila DSM 6578]|uniref:Ribosome-binding ATPase YchF n=1 Tax=Winmispira thermophila (strain ATCC 700085 / DSM 6578 / Z-1203) TaxID=869211 RepID=G0GFI9_WINT7|nr:redox-regulated ATPase YchF [Spirochaeta thermophila]AEJ62388.1 GTP-binding protein YchF [Spirochaeta thermophila DSM 6578]
MALNCGIVGLPNVGKSTIFSALTAAPAEAANYPFCTIDPNVGIVEVPDPRLHRIAEIIHPRKVVPAAMEFVDIAGLVRGASKGEGLGNQFLAHIRQVGIIAHVVRCFEDPDVAHVSGKVDPAEDIATITTELCLADLETVEKRLARLEKQRKSHDRIQAKQAEETIPLLQRVGSRLSEGVPVRAQGIEKEELERLSDLFLLTAKKQIYVCNVDEEGIHTENDYVKAVRDIAESEGADVVVLCGKLEAEIAMLEDPEERRAFLEDAGLSEPALNVLIRAAFHTLGLRTFFTAGEKEARAWPFPEGITAQEAAGLIHTDFMKGFVRAEVYRCDDLFELGSEQKIREAGRLRLEGRDYIVQDGDVVYFRVNV